MFNFIKKQIEKDVIVIIDGNYLRSSFINYLFYTNINTSLNIKKFNKFISNNKMTQGYIIINNSFSETYITQRDYNEWNKFAENGYIILNNKTFLDIIKENKNKEIILVGNDYYKNMMKIYDIKMYVFYSKCNKQIMKMKNVYFLENYIHLITNSNIYTKIIICYYVLKFNIFLLINKINK